MSHTRAEQNTRSGRKILPHSQGDMNMPPYDPLSTVKLPPPSSASDGAYGWISGSGQTNAGNLNSNINMLRTPDSIMRPADEHALKRVSAASHETSKRAKRFTPDAPILQSSEENAAEQHSSDRSIAMPPTKADNSRQWSAYFSRAFPGFEFGTDRPNSTSPTFDHHNHPILPTGISGDYVGPPIHSSSQYLRGNAMLSPNSPHGVGTAFTHTPTRSGRPQSVGSGLDYYNSTMAPQRGTAHTFIIPPLPPSALGNVMPPYDPDANFNARQSAPELKHIEVPPPDKMPPIEDDGSKPNYSYAMLIGMAILRAPGRKLTLAQIYTWIMETFSYYRKSKPAWHNSIRHNLSLNKAFEKRVRPKEDPGKGSYWTIVEGLEYQFFKPNKPKKIDMLPAVDDTLQKFNTNSTMGTETRTRYTSGSPNDPHKASLSHGSDTSTKSISSSRSKYSLDRVLSEPQTEKGRLSKNSETDSLKEAVSYYSNHQDAIPSDGTEPDDRLVEEREKQAKLHLPSSSSHEQDQTTHESAKDDKSPVRDRKLPQMHAMSTVSSRPISRVPFYTQTETPSSPSISSPTMRISDSSIVNSANGISAKVATSSNGSNEWRGQGQFSFRCSTPSLVRDSIDTPSLPLGNVPSLNYTNQITLNEGQAPLHPLQALNAGIFEKGVSLGAENHYKEQYGKSEALSMGAHTRALSSYKQSVENTGRRNFHSQLIPNHFDHSRSPTVSPTLKQTRKARSTGTDVSNLTQEADNKSWENQHYKSRGAGQSLADHHHLGEQPRTPEKGTQISLAVPSTNKQKVQFLRPAMLQRQSLESPYAGTLDFSPGISLSDEHHFVNLSHHKKSSIGCLSDFLDLELHSKVESNSSKHSRTTSDSSDDGVGAQFGSSGHNYVTNLLGSASHANSFSLPLEFELSPKMVVTPVRRPFDTPIRDQSHAYSPYCKTSNGIGSPLRRQ